MELMQMTDYLDSCCEAARIGGRQLDAYRSRFQVREKAINDLVTDADIASQRAIHDHLQTRFPEHHFLGEESLDLAMTANTESEFSWIVDPLDGTLNYVHQLPSWSVSVALRFREQIIAAAVFDPWLDEMFLAGSDGPATLNGQPLRSSECREPDECLLVVSLPARLTAQSPEISQLNRLLCATRSVRRLGSAALNLCYLAAGRIDGYWATSLNLWDIAGGWLIAERAGGIIRNPAGQPFDPAEPRLLATATAELSDQIVRILQPPRA